MKQFAAVITRTGALQVEIPPASESLFGSVLWGPVDACPTPAYWRFQVIAHRLTHSMPNYRLGRNLVEEAAACLLGGHGIPASIGLAAFEKLRDLGAFRDPLPSREQLESWLREPIALGDRTVRYRFAAQKSLYLAQALPALRSAPCFESGRSLRDWLIALPGIGPKTASWIARNSMNADDVAILDVHILRVFKAMGLFPAALGVERNYFELEQRFLQFCDAIDVRASELDAVIWLEMASSPALARFLDRYLAQGVQNKNDLLVKLSPVTKSFSPE